MNLRWLLFIALAGLHAGATVFPSGSLAPVVAGTIYLPLMPLQVVGVPVFATAESGGWPAPSPLGWFAVIVLWLAIWWMVALLGARLFSRRSGHA